MIVPVGSDKHARGWSGDNRTLCGIADEGNPGDADTPPPAYAAPGLRVTCHDCKAIIAHCRDRFTDNYRVRRASQGEEVR